VRIQSDGRRIGQLGEGRCGEHEQLIFVIVLPYPADSEKTAFFTTAASVAGQNIYMDTSQAPKAMISYLASPVEGRNRRTASLTEENFLSVLTY
jgi:hypothetical protein